MKRINILDSMPTGFLVGFLLPLIIFIVVYFVTSGDRSFSDYISMIQRRNVVTHFISLSVFPNVFAFLLFYRFDREQSAKGVLGITIIWALTVFLLKMI